MKRVMLLCCLLFVGVAQASWFKPHDGGQGAVYGVHDNAPLIHGVLWIEDDGNTNAVGKVESNPAKLPLYIRGGDLYFVRSDSSQINLSMGYDKAFWDLGSSTNVWIQGIASSYLLTTTNATTIAGTTSAQPDLGFTITIIGTNSVSLPAEWFDPFDAASNWTPTTNNVICVWRYTETNWQYAVRWEE